ncbi:MAG: CoA-binding protein [Alphaproteobacteria bacterium]|nr:CoA-binding protein [Alphaproteobacteria bacterium]
MRDPGPDARPLRRANLKRLLTARRIAFVGGAMVEGAIRYCADLGFRGEVWAVNPRRATLGGVACYPSLDALPGLPDAAFVATAPDTAVGIVADLAVRGVPAAVCYAAGFAEVGDGSRQARLAEAAGATMALVGPNCIGTINYFDAVPVIVGNHGLARPERGVAIIAQSGTITINLVGADRSLPVGYLLSIGNQAVLDMADYIDVVLDDPRVSAIVLYIEGLKDVEAFAAACAKAFTRGVPLVALKAGLSAMGQQIALSHTGSLAGSAEMYDALFDRLNVMKVATFSELLEAAKLLASGTLPAGNRLAIETCSGTDSGYCADLAERFGVALPQPSPAVQASLRAVLPAIATASNPLDVTMAQWGDREAQAMSLIALLEEPADAAALIINYPHNAATGSYGAAIDAMIDVRRTTDLPCYVITNLPEGAPEAVRARLAEHGIVTLQGIEDAFAVLGRTAGYVARRQRLQASDGPECRLVGLGDLGQARAWDEWASKAWLRRAGVALPDGRRVANIDGAVSAASEIGFPVVVKATGPKLLHKSELGAVALNLTSVGEVRAAASAMGAVPGIAGFIVERMIGDGVAELIVGAKRDPLFGLSLVIGAGGVLTELLRDSRTLLLPVREEDVREAIANLRVSTLIGGYRGRPPGDVDALVATILGIAAAIEADAATIAELDVNPLIVRPNGKGVVAVDALVTMGEHP